MAAGNHIRQCVLEVNVPTIAEARDIQVSLAEEFYRLTLKLEEIISLLVPPDLVLKIDRMDLALGSVRRQELCLTLPDRFKDELQDVLAKRAVRHQADFTESALVSRADHALATIAFFVDRGYLPWHASVSSLKELASEISDKSVLFRMLWKKMVQGKQYCYRVTQHFSPALLQDLFIWALKDSGDFNKKGKIAKHESMLTLSAKFSTSRWYVLFRQLVAMAGSSGNIPALKDLPAAAHDTSSRDSILSDLEAFVLAPESTAMEEQVLYVGHAGVVILHPYLESFFAHLGIWNDRQFPHPTDQAQAVRILHCLATGKKNHEEHELTLAKILMGYPLHAPVPVDFPLPDNFEREADTLLQAVIRNWSTLKNTSVAGLRNTFFDREAKMIRTGDTWKIVVERQATDVLLQYMPWSLSIISLPWIDKPISVEWA